MDAFHRNDIINRKQFYFRATGQPFECLIIFIDMKYLNLNGNSSVVAFEILPHAIMVLFRTGGWYTYSYRSAGQDKVETMKSLAVRGYGLCSYINRNARYLYER